MIKTLQEIATALGLPLRGDPQCRIHGIASLARAKAGELSFLTDIKYQKQLQTTAASAVIISEKEADLCSLPALISSNPRLALAKAATLFQPQTVFAKGVHPTAVIGENCRIATTASIGPHCVVGSNVEIQEGVVIEALTVIGNHCIIAANTQLKPKVTLYDNVKVGQHCIIHSGAVIGADGFGYAQDAEGSWIKMPHLAGVTIGNHVEIGANTTIDRGVFEDTVLGDGVIIDNLVQIGHNVSIGDKTAIAGTAAIAGSTRVGKECMLGGGARVGGHIEITDKVYLTATTGVNQSITQPGVYSAGLPAGPNAVWRRNAARFLYLDDMAKRLRKVEGHLGIFTDKFSDNTSSKHTKSQNITQSTTQCTTMERSKAESQSRNAKSLNHTKAESLTAQQTTELE